MLYIETRNFFAVADEDEERPPSPGTEQEGIYSNLSVNAQKPNSFTNIVVLQTFMYTYSRALDFGDF